MNNNKKYIIAGFLSVIPIWLTYIIANFLFETVSKPGATIINKYFPILSNYLYSGEIIGFLIVLISVYLIGMLVSNILFKKLLGSLEDLISGIPVVNMIYKTIKQITSSLGDPEKESFKKVVIIEYPKDGIWTLAMVTGESKDEKSNEYYNIYIPTTPNPTSGFLLFLEEKDIVYLDMSVEDAAKLVISAGLVLP